MEEIEDMLHWLFLKPEDEIVDEAEIEVLNSLFLLEDMRSA